MNITMLLKKGFTLALISNFFVWQLALAAPEGGQVVAGSATVTQTTNQTTVNQTSQNAVINWHGFDTAATESVKFTQPNSSSIALNRINSGQPTNFQGSLSANGQVWILNPSGVLFGASSKVDVAGLLVTTHNITDSNFMSGNYQFTFDPNNINSRIINNGLISVADSGIVALVGPGVENNGTIIANLGKVYLSSGDAFVLDMYGDNLINFGTSPAIQKGYVSNSGLIKASGGKVHMTANAAAGVLDNVISMSGVIEATTATTGRHGEIILNGGHAGTVHVSGKLNASNGGSIETSGNNIVIDSPEDINAGVGGSWTLDPPVIYTSTWDNTSVGNLIAYQLNNGTDVTLSTGVSGSGVGDIYVDSPITWNTSAVLMLGAYRDINISAPINATNSGGFIARADLSANGTGTINFSGSGAVTVDGSNGYARLYYNPTGGNYAAPTDYSPFLLGSAPIQAAYMMINTQAELVAAGAGYAFLQADNYSLNNDIDGSVFSAPIFGNVSFVGHFDGHDYATGLNHAIYNVNMSGGSFGVMALMNVGRVENLGITTCLLADCSTGSGSNVVRSVGGAVGGFFYQNFGTLSNVNFRGELVSPNDLAGIVAWQALGTIENSYSSGDFFQTFAGGNNIGGIAAFLQGGTIKNSYSSAILFGSSVTGGIVGSISTSFFPAILQNDYFVGLIASGNFFDTGAVVGLLGSGIATVTVSGLYWDTQTAGVSFPVGFFSLPVANTGLSDAQMQSLSNFTGYSLSVWQNGSGSYPYPVLIPNSQAIHSTQMAGNLGAAAAGQTVSIYADNILVGSAIANGSGVYFMNFNPDAVYASNPNIIFATTSGAVTGDYVAKTYGPVGNLDIVNNQITVRSDTGVPVLNSEMAAQTHENLYTTSAPDITLNSGVNFLTTAGVSYSSVFITPNTPYNMDGSIFQGNDVTFNGPVTVTLIGNPAFIINGGNTVFNSTLDGPNDLFINSAGNVTFNDVVGVTTNPLDFLNVTSAQTNINTSQIFTVQGANFISPVFINSGGPMTFNGDVAFFGPVESTGIAPQIIINGNLILGDVTVGAASDIASLSVLGTGISRIYTDLLKTSGDIIFAGSVNLTGDSVMTSTAGNITFENQVSGNGCGFAWGLTVTTTSGLGTTTFEGDIGLPVFALDGMVSFLTVNGTSVINGTTIIQTDGNQTYGDTITLNNSVTMKTLIDGDIQFNGGGAVDPGITLSLYSADAAKGPTGLGITGTVNVDNLILGGPGGANLSLNYPITESFVGGPSGGAGQAIQNTVIDPLADFRSSGAIYCVNNLCSLLPAPSTNSFPTNVLSTQEFNLPEGPSCGEAGCDNLDIIIYPIGIPPELLYSSEESNLLGVVTDTAGDPSQAIDPMGHVRDLKVGSAVNKDDHLIVAETGCMCMKSTLGEKKCISTTKNYDATHHMCKKSELNKINHKNNTVSKPQTLTTVLATMKNNVGAMLAAPVVEKPEIKKSDSAKDDRAITWEHFPLTTHDLYLR